DSRLSPRPPRFAGLGTASNGLGNSALPPDLPQRLTPVSTILGTVWGLGDSVGGSLAIRDPSRVADPTLTDRPPPCRSDRASASDMQPRFTGRAGLAGARLHRKEPRRIAPSSEAALIELVSGKRVG